MEDHLLDALRQLTSKPDASFRPGQREAIQALVEQRTRVLLVQRTGWGKSAVYFLATHLLRQQGLGPTLLISPLLALMRNQIEAASRLGLRTMTVNSSNDTTVRELADAVQADQVDLIVVSPERLANPEFADKVMPLVGRRPGLIVIDEAHCISDWGHDFRPDYRRLAQVVDGLGGGVPVLACTATANDRVVNDVAEQLGAVGHVVRGPLGRDGLALHVIDLPSAARRLAWLATVLPTLPGTGIVYCLTVRDTERVTEWLQRQGLNVRSYSGAADPEARLAAEDDLLNNRIKALVATSALGMGYDKPDVGFVIHFQAPGSPVAYYQQVGRAGRQLQQSVGVLLRGNEDRDIQDWFITTAFPPADRVHDVLMAFDQADGPLTMTRVLEQVNMKRGDCELVLKQLTVEGALRRLSGQTYERTLKRYTYPHERVRAVTADRRAEQQQMLDYSAQAGCRMAFLTDLLDDPDTGNCGVCDRCSGVSLDVALDDALVAAAQRFSSSGYLTIEPRLAGVAPPLRAEPGRVLCRWNDDPWGRLVADGRRAGHFDDRLVGAAAEMVRDWPMQPPPTWITFVPSLRQPALVADFAQRLGDELGLPVHPIVTKVRNTESQRTQQNSAHQQANVRRVFALAGSPDPGPVLLVDDLVDSRWTLTAVTGRLRDAGSGPVYPLALASTTGGDS